MQDGIVKSRKMLGVGYICKFKAFIGTGLHNAIFSFLFIKLKASEKCLVTRADSNIRSPHSAEALLRLC